MNLNLFDPVMESVLTVLSRYPLSELQQACEMYNVQSVRDLAEIISRSRFAGSSTFQALPGIVDQAAQMPINIDYNLLNERLANDDSFPPDSQRVTTHKYKNIPEKFIQADPTKKKYIGWIIDSYCRGGIRRFEDLGRTRVALAKYQKLLDLKLVEQWYTNIGRFCGIAGCSNNKGIEILGLEEYLERPEFAEALARWEQVQAEEVIKDTDYRVIVDNPVVKIIQPLTRKGSCTYGGGTKWCTAATTSDNMFDRYNASGPLFILIPKNPTIPNEKYQLSTSTASFMDRQDAPVEINDQNISFMSKALSDLASAQKKVLSSQDYVDFLVKLLRLVPKIIPEIPDTVLDLLKLQKGISTSEYARYIKDIIMLTDNVIPPFMADLPADLMRSQNSILTGQVVAEPTDLTRNEYIKYLIYLVGASKTISPPVIEELDTTLHILKNSLSNNAYLSTVFDLFANNPTLAISVPSILQEFSNRDNISLLDEYYSTHYVREAKFLKAMDILVSLGYDLHLFKKAIIAFFLDFTVHKRNGPRHPAHLVSDACLQIYIPELAQFKENFCRVAKEIYDDPDNSAIIKEHVHYLKNHGPRSLPHLRSYGVQIGR